VNTVSYAKEISGVDQVWALLTKLTDALGIAVSGWALALFGYVPNVVQTD